MRRFFSRDDFSDLESQLRNARPEPRGELLDELVSRVQPMPTRVPTRRPRIAAALVFAVVVLISLAAFGGVSYATSSFVSAAKSSGHAVSAIVKKGDGKQSGSNNQGNNNQDENSGNSQAGSSSNFNQQGGSGGGGHHDPPWVHQYSHFVLICYPIPVFVRGRIVIIRRTILIPRFALPFFVPPGTLGRCGSNPV